MAQLLSRFRKDDSGATAIEYGMIALFISVVIVAAVTQVGDSLNGFFLAIAAAFS